MIPSDSARFERKAKLAPSGRYAYDEKSYSVVSSSLLPVPPAPESQVPQPMSDVTVFEGARLITGEDTRPIESATFTVEDGRLMSVGRTGEVAASRGRNPAST